MFVSYYGRFGRSALFAGSMMLLVACQKSIPAQQALHEQNILHEGVQDPQSHPEDIDGAGGGGSTAAGGEGAGGEVAGGAEGEEKGVAGDEDTGGGEKGSDEKGRDRCAGVSLPKGMVCIPAATFVRGVNKDSHRCDMYQQPKDKHSASVPAMEVSVDAYAFDIYEVTNADFRACQKAGKCRTEGTMAKYDDFDAPKQPVTGVSWYDAQDYCAFAGKRLPTEAEWEHVARGPDNTTYPWGNSRPDCTKTVIMDKHGRSCGERKRHGSKPKTGRVLEVGSRPAGHYGVYDMGGNTQEWVADWWSRDYAECGEACQGHNPKGPCQGAEPCGELEYRVVRGGSWYWDGSHTAGYHRRRHKPNNYPYHHFGFRCAKSI